MPARQRGSAEDKVPGYPYNIGHRREHREGSGPLMSNNAEAFEHWIRTAFVQMNTELEELYFAQRTDRA